MTGDISAILSSMALALITMLGLAFVAYSIFWQRITKDETRINPWKISKEERRIGTDIKIITWWVTVCVIFDFVFAYLLTFEMFKQLPISTVCSVLLLLSSLEGFLLIINFVCIIVFPSHLYLAVLTLIAGKHNDALSNANDALTELAKYIIPEKRCYNLLKRLKRRDVHTAYTVKGRACMGLAKEFISKDDLEKRQKLYVEAIESFNEALKFDKKCKSCLIHRGMSYGEMGGIKKASEDFKKARELNKKRFDKYYKQEVDEWMEEKGIHIDF